MIKKFPPTDSQEQQSNGGPETDRLDSWKEIANYLRREVRTVQLWEQREGLPVHRHFHKQLGSVFAFRGEIDGWKRQVSRSNTPKGGLAAALRLRTSGRITIYVLPLENKTFHSEHQALCDAIVTKTMKVLEQLHAGQLNIVSLEFPKQSAPSCKTSDKGALEYALQWNLQYEGNGLRVKVALGIPEADGVEWSHSYPCRPEDFSEMPAYIADQIVQCLWLKVFSCSTSRPATRHGQKRGSREACLKGRYFWNQRNEEGLRKAIHCFESAIQEDPAFAPAYSGLADSLTLLSFYEIVSPFDAMPSARRAALKAIELDPNLAEAHASLADIFLHFDRDWPSADREYRRSIQCDPDYALGYHWYANLLAAKGQHEAANIAIMRALEINPVSIITLVWAGVTSHLAHRFNEAIQHYQSALDLDPQFIWAHMYMAQALEQTGDFHNALREFETTIRLAGGSNCVQAMKAHTHAVAGDKSSARDILRELKSATSGKCTPSYDIAATYAALGETSQAVSWLNRACDERNMKLFTLTQDPRFDPLRHRSEFQEIVELIGLAQYSPARS